MDSRRKKHGGDLERLSSHLEDVFQSMLISTRTVHVRARESGLRGWRPSIDVYETEGVIHIVAELAGVDEDQIAVELDNGTLTIRGERSPICTDHHRSVHEMGILYGPFAARVYLPAAVDRDSVQAAYEQGLLHITLNRIQPTRIEITRESDVE